MTVAAPPVDGKANKAIVAYLAGFFGLQKSEAQLVGGQPSRQKTCILAHLKEEEVREKLMDFAGCQPPTGSMP